MTRVGPACCGVAARQPFQRQGRAAHPFGLVAATSRKNVSPNLVGRDPTRQSRSARGSLDWWARMAATPRRRLMRVSSCPRSTPTMSRRTPRPFRRCSGNLFVSHPDLKVNQTKWRIRALTRTDQVPPRRGGTQKPVFRHPFPLSFFRVRNYLSSSSNERNTAGRRGTRVAPRYSLIATATLNAAVVRDGQPFPPGSVDEFVLLLELRKDARG